MHFSRGGKCSFDKARFSWIKLHPEDELLIYLQSCYIIQNQIDWFVVMFWTSRAWWQINQFVRTGLCKNLASFFCSAFKQSVNDCSNVESKDTVNWQPKKCKYCHLSQWQQTCLLREDFAPYLFGKGWLHCCSFWWSPPNNEAERFILREIFKN